MAERDEPRVPEEEVQAEKRDAVGHEGQHERDVVDGGSVGEGEREGDRHEERDGPESPHAVTTFPKSPRGRSTSTVITIR